jgi:uncharacterized protein YuzE
MKMGSEVKIKYDPQVDILRIRLGSTPIEESREVEPGVIVDYDEQGQIVGLEILDASEIVQSPKPAAVHAEE